MNKYLIAGGASVAGLVGFLFIRSRRSAPQESAPVDTGFSGMLYSPPPISGGYSSGGGSVSVSVPNSQGGTIGGDSAIDDGGFMKAMDFSSLIKGMFDSQTEQAKLRYSVERQTTDAATLAGINLGAYGGMASTEHTVNGTTLSVNPALDPMEKERDQFIDGLYQSMFNRAPDAAGEAYWKQQMRNGVSYGTVANEFQHSAEYDYRYNPEHRNNYDVTLDSSGNLIGIREKAKTA